MLDDPELKSQFVLPSWKKSLIVSILSAGTFVGALIAGDLSDIIGRKWTIVIGCLIYIIGKHPDVRSVCKACLLT